VAKHTPTLRVEQLERLLREQGFHRIAAVSSRGLPAHLSRHPAIAALGEGTFVLAVLSCHRQEADDPSSPGDPHALIAPFARRNYYAEAVARMKKVVRALSAAYGLSKREVRIFCNSRLPEKSLAVASGLGSFGKNTLILIPGLGSLFVIAGLFVPVPVRGRFSQAAEGAAASLGSSVSRSGKPAGSTAGAARPRPDDRAEADDRFPLCGSCRICQDACPVGALQQAGRLDESRCLQALCTRLESFSPAFRRAWSVRLYGCQSCQEVCPHNRGLALQTSTGRGELGAGLPLKHLLALSADQVKERVRGSALDRSWIPARALLRNALLAAGNRRDPALLDSVHRLCADADPLVAAAAAWAEGRISAALQGSGCD